MNRQKKWQSFFDAAESVCNQCYHIEYHRRYHEIVCPRYTFKDNSYIIVIPWFLIPGRPYPIQVYLHACSLYSSNPKLSQRAVAESIRVKFKLETFSHSTVSRSFRSFERARKHMLEQRFGEEHKPGIEAAVKTEAERNIAPDSGKRFPSLADTSTRREEMTGFFRKFLSVSKELDTEVAGRQFVKRWHKKNRRLLL